MTLSDRLEHEPTTSRLSAAIERDAAQVVGRQWDRKLHPLLLEDMGKYRKYDTSSVRDCLRLMRNKKNHFMELSAEVKSLLSPMPDGFITYFEKRFPKLLMHAVQVVSTHLADEKDFNKTFLYIASLFRLDNTPKDQDTNIGLNSSNGIKQRLTNETNDVKIDDIKDETTIWCGSNRAAEEQSRGWWRGDSTWASSFVHMQCRNKPRPGHLVKSSTDPKYRSRLCTHWELTNGTACPMRKKGKCVFAHGPLELRIKESRKDRWGGRSSIDNNNDLRSSGGEDVLGAARSIEKIRVIEGSISDYEKSTKIRVNS